MFKIKFFLISVLLFITFFLNCIEPLSDGYKDIKLGMSKENVQSILEKSIEFNFKREEILTFRLEPDTEPGRGQREPGGAWLAGGRRGCRDRRCAASHSRSFYRFLAG